MSTRFLHLVSNYNRDLLRQVKMRFSHCRPNDHSSGTVDTKSLQLETLHLVCSDISKVTTLLMENNQRSPPHR